MYAIANEKLLFCDVPKSRTSNSQNYQFENLVYVNLIRQKSRLALSDYTPPVRKVYRGYIVFAFSVIMFVCLSVNFFSVKDFSATTWVRVLKFGTKLDSDELYCVTKKKNS